MVSFVYYSTLAFSVPIAIQVLVLFVSCFYIKPNWLICPIWTQVMALVGTLAIWLFNLFAVTSYNSNYLNIAGVIMVIFWLATALITVLLLNEIAPEKQEVTTIKEEDEIKHIDILV